MKSALFGLPYQSIALMSRTSGGLGLHSRHHLPDTSQAWFEDDERHLGPRRSAAIELQSRELLDGSCYHERLGDLAFVFKVEGSGISGKRFTCTPRLENMQNYIKL